jgi:3-phytase
LSEIAAISAIVRLGLIAATLAALACGSPRVVAQNQAIAPIGETAPVPNESDDPAIWRHPTDPARSLILGTDKIEGIGGLYVFDLDGRLTQAIAPLDRPNNVDVEHGVAIAGQMRDIAVVTERKQRRLRLYGIDGDGRLTDLAPAGLPVLAGGTGEEGEPMGIGVFKRASDGAVFVVVSPKSGPKDGYLAQYRLADGEGGAPALTLVRRFGAFSQVGPTPAALGEIEAVVVDDALGYVYYADERCCLRKYAADPDAPDASRELAAFGQSGYAGDREGLAIFDDGRGGGYLVSVDQTVGRSALLLYPRRGEESDPHRHAVMRRLLTASDATDGLEIRADLVRSGGPRGLLVMMHDARRSFHLYDPAAILDPTR